MRKDNTDWSLRLCVLPALQLRPYGRTFSIFFTSCNCWSSMILWYDYKFPYWPLTDRSSREKKFFIGCRSRLVCYCWSDLSDIAGILLSFWLLIIYNFFKSTLNILLQFLRVIFTFLLMRPQNNSATHKECPRIFFIKKC